MSETIEVDFPPRRNITLAEFADQVLTPQVLQMVGLPDTPEGRAALSGLVDRAMGIGEVICPAPVILEPARCKTCEHFCPDTTTPYGSCNRWRQGYAGFSDMPLNEVQVEDDEGWGAAMGPDFGCVLHEPSPILGD